MSRRFNGATSSRTWKGVTALALTPNGDASMEPRPHERGKLPGFLAVGIDTAALQWSHVLTNVERSSERNR